MYFSCGQTNGSLFYACQWIQREFSQIFLNCNEWRFCCFIVGHSSPWCCSKSHTRRIHWTKKSIFAHQNQVEFFCQNIPDAATNNSGNEFFHSLSSPFDGDTFLGWAATFCTDVIFAPTYGTIYISTGSFFMAIGLYFKACVHHFRSIFTEMREIHGGESTIEQKSKSFIVEAVNFHNSTK